MSKQTRNLSHIARDIYYDTVNRVYDKAEEALESGVSTTKYTVEYILSTVIQLLTQELSGHIWDDIDEEEMEAREND